MRIVKTVFELKVKVAFLAAMNIFVDSIQFKVGNLNIFSMLIEVSCLIIKRAK